MLLDMRRRSLILVAGLALVLFLAPAALAADDHSGHGAGPAQAQPDASAPQIPDTAVDHAQMGHEPVTAPTPEPQHHGIHNDAQGRPEDRQSEAPAGQQHDSHDQTATEPASRPRVLVLGSFAGLNVLLLVAAAVVRQRIRLRRAHHAAARPPAAA